MRSDAFISDVTIPLDGQADRFYIPRGVRYLNCAYAAPLLRSVERAAHHALRRWRTPQRFGAEAYFDEAERVRALFARLIGAPNGEGIALVPGVSYGIGIAARNVGVTRQGNVVLAAGQFPSNVYAWRRLCRTTGAELRVVERPTGGGWNERLLEAIDQQTAVVALGTVDWIDGTLFDLEAIGDRAREVGAAYVLDGIQSLGALPFDVTRVRPDLLVTASYKWLLGPMGLGLCYIGERFADGEPLEETWLGRHGSEDFSTLTTYTDRYQPGARRFDAGGRAQFMLLPMLAAALEALLAWQPHRIQAYCTSLVAPVIAELAALGIATTSADRHAMHLFGVQPPADLPIAQVRELLARQRVHVSVRTGRLRVSPNVYNTASDLDALVDALRAMIRSRSQPRRRRMGHLTVSNERPISAALG